MAGGNLAGAAGRGIASAAGAVAKPFQDAWSQAAQQQAQNAAAMQGGQQQQPQQIPGVGGVPNPNVQGGAQAQVDPAVAQDVTQQGQQQPQQQQGQQPWSTEAQPAQGGPGMVGSQSDMAQQRLMQMSSDDPSAYDSIESILKGL